jgi:hypothetical protein
VENVGKIITIDQWSIFLNNKDQQSTQLLL